MAAGLPVAAPSVGDVGQMVAEANWPYIAPHVDAVELRDMITMLARDKAERKAVGAHNQAKAQATRSEEHTSELQSLMRNSYAVFCLKKKKTNKQSRVRYY